jgi:hypothetical protein
VAKLIAVNCAFDFEEPTRRTVAKFWWCGKDNCAGMPANDLRRDDCCDRLLLARIRMAISVTGPRSFGSAISRSRHWE